MRSQIVGIIILSCFVLGSFTSQISYFTQRAMAFSRYIEKMESGAAAQVISLSLPAHTFQWEKQDKEFIYQGRLYDVITIECSGDLLLISCMTDKAEDEILANYLKSTDTDSKEKINPPASKDQCSPTIPILICTSYPVVHEFIAFLQPYFLTPGIEIFAPPPEQSGSSPVDSYV